MRPQQEARSFFVNLPLRYIRERPGYFDFFLEHKLCPELGMDAVSLSSPMDWHSCVAKALKERGLSCSVHLPFMDLQPGSIDPFILDATRERLGSALETAKIYDPVVMIGHMGYDPVLYKDSLQPWMERSIDTWRSLLSSWPDRPLLALENVWEKECSWFSDFFKGLEGENVGCCLDLGHWFSFAGGCTRSNLSEWIDNLSDNLVHLHLHDNLGDTDEHLGLGQGNMDWELFFTELADRALRPGFTLEPHTPQALAHSLQFMKKNRTWFTSLGIDVDSVKGVGVDDL